MRADLTDITMILDRSGSMASVAADTIGGVNTFMDEQRRQPGDLLVTLVQFDDQAPFEVIYSGKRVQDVPNLTAETFVPRGNTPLLDAIGKGIAATGERLSKLAADQRPSKVLFVIITDGAENASKEYSGEQIAKMIGTQRDTYSWQFVFIGANQDAIATAKAMNIPASAALNYAANAKGTQAVFRAASANLCSVRGGQMVDYSFSNEQRQEQVAAGANP